MSKVILMQRISTIILSFLLLISCARTNGFPGNKNSVTPQGKMVKGTISASNFTAINARSMFDVRVHQGNAYSVTYSIPKNMVPYLDIKVQNNTLNIGWNDKINISNAKNSKGKTYKFIVNVTMPSLTSITASGMSDVDILSSFQGKGLSLSCSGMSEVSLKKPVAYYSFNINCSGMSEVSLGNQQTHSITIQCSGQSEVSMDNQKTESMNITCSGQSEIEAKSVTATNMNMTVSGQSDIKVSKLISQSVVAEANGQSTIKVKGGTYNITRKSVSGMSEINMK